MPPPKPSAGPDDERRRDAAAEADRLGREHSNKRDLKARAERVRQVADDRGRTGVPGVPGAPVVQPRSRSESRSEGRSESRSDNSVDNEAQRARDGRPPARPAVVQPPVRERNLVERPKNVPKSARQERTLRTDTAVVEAGGVIDEVAIEAEDLLRDVGGAWSRMTVADKISFFSALLVLLGTFLPWSFRAHEAVVLGVGAGGVVHAAIAIAAMGLLIARERPSHDERGLRPTPGRQRARARRTALYLMLLSLVSTVAGTWFLLATGMIRRFEVPTLEVGAGLYLSLAAGLGLSYSGFAFFWRASKGEAQR